MGKFKRAGVWYGRVKDEHGRWIKKTLNTSDPKVAAIRYRELERCAASPTYRAASETTFGAAADDFETSRRVKGCADGTMNMYQTKLGHLERLFGSDTPLRALEPPAGAALVDRYIDTRLGEGKKLHHKGIRNTIGKELTTLRGLLKVAKRAGKYSGDLDAVMPTEWCSDYEPRRTALTPAQVAALITALTKPREKRVIAPKRKVRPREPWTWVGRVEEADRRNRAAMVAFIVATGFRLGEARRATRGQVDLERGLVYCEITKTRKKGKREKWVPITPATRPLLEQVLAATEGRVGAMFDQWTNVTRDLAQACAAVKGCPRATPNDLRRTHANWLRDAGVDTASIADVLGHVDSRMVEKVYGKLRPEQLRDRVLASVH